MDKLKVLIAICVLCCIAGCSPCGILTTCIGDSGSVEFPAYANKSGKAVKMVAIIESFHGYEAYLADCDIFPYCYTVEELIADGDTLHSYIADEWKPLWLMSCQHDNCRDRQRRSRMELHFLDNSEKCLIFDGPVEDNGFDMRSWKSYKKGPFIDNGETYAIEYVYAITPEHRAMAKEEFCP